MTTSPPTNTWRVGSPRMPYLMVVSVLRSAFSFTKVTLSPYSPASRLFWNELYLDLHKLATAVGVPAPQAPPIKVDEPIDYRAQYRWRRPFIDLCAQRLLADDSFRVGVDAWAREHGVYDYAAFRAIGERERTGWGAWPAAVRDGTQFAATREAALAMGGEARSIDAEPPGALSPWRRTSGR